MERRSGSASRALIAQEDRVALARPEVRIGWVAHEDLAVGNVDDEEVVRCDVPLWTPVGANSSPATIGRSADPATGPGDPAPGVEGAQELDQELPGGKLCVAHEDPAVASGAANDGAAVVVTASIFGDGSRPRQAGPVGVERNSTYTSPAMRFLNRFVDSNDREIRRLQPLVDATNALEAEYEAMSDEEIRAAFDELRADVLEAAAPDEPSDDEHPPTWTSSAAESWARSVGREKTPDSSRALDEILPDVLR